MCRRVLLVCLALVMSACQSAPLVTPEPTSTALPTSVPTIPPTLVPTANPLPTATPLPSATPTPTAVPTRTPLPILRPFPDNYFTEVYVGDYKTMITCRGTGEPTILLENGLNYNSWGNTWGAIPFWEISRTCYYLRVGTYLEAAPGLRTTLDQVKDLHSILEQTGIPGPYILVGHSIGGFNLLVYTKQYPEEVVGLVCVDCRYPALEAIFLSKLKQEFAADANGEEKIRTLTKAYGLAATDPSIIFNTSEGLDVYNSSKQVMQVSNLGNRPFVVLVALTPVATPVPDKVKTDQLYFQSWREAAEKLSQLSSLGRMEVVPNVDHISILMNGAVTRVIQEVYDRVTKP